MRRLPTLLPGAVLAALLLLAAGCASVADRSIWNGREPQAVPARPDAAVTDIAVSSAATALSQTAPDGSAMRYANADEAVRAGDAAGLIRQLYQIPDGRRDKDGFNNAFLALDRAADGDLAGARAYLGITSDALLDKELPGFYVWLDAWFLALEGEPDAALTRHRDIADSMPGLTSDLSLAALLEASGRTDEALAVYDALTPARIEAPEHEFDPKGIMFAHVSSVIVRHSLLLQRLGRIEEAQSTYQRLADSQPEQATSYAAAIESLATGRNLDNEPLTAVTGFSQSLSDVSAALQQERYLSQAFMGLTMTGFDTQRAAFDLMILVVDPSNRNVRSSLVNALYEQAYYQAAAHVALAAPAPSPSLQISAAQALLMSGDEAGARGAIARALALTEEDDRLSTLYGALQLSALLNDGNKAMSLLPEVLSLADNPAERAAANGLAGSIYDHFGEAVLAVEHAEEARRLDDTHQRRMALANYLGKADRVNDALVILRSERLARPNDPYTLNSLGYFLITRTDRLDEGYRLLARALLMAEGDPYISDSLGWAIYQFGDLDRARRLIEGAREDLKPQSHWEIEDHLGDIYWHRSDPDAARAAWQLALDNHPPLPERDMIARKLEEGLTTPPPDKRPIPEIRIEDVEITRRGI